MPIDLCKILLKGFGMVAMQPDLPLTKCTSNYALHHRKLNTIDMIVIICIRPICIIIHLC